MKTNETTAATEVKTKYLVSDSFIGQRVPEGVRVLWDDQHTYQCGELIATSDFIGESCVEVEYIATDFSNTDPFYQRTMTTEVAGEAVI